MPLIRALAAQVPPWMRPSHPVLRYTRLRDQRGQRWFERWGLRLGGAGVVIGLLLIGYRAHEAGYTLGLDAPRSSAVYSILYFPLVVLQLLAALISLLSTSSMLDREQQRGTWEPLKITSHGAELAVRARWAMVFYQLRVLLLLIMLPRLVFAGSMVIGLTDYQGEYLDLAIQGISPAVSVEMATLLLAALITAGLLQPLVIIGLNAAAGLFLSTAIRSRHAAGLLGAVLFGTQFILFGTALLVSSLPGLPTRLSWRGQFFIALTGDHSLRLLDLGALFRVWADLDNGVLIGAALLGSTVGLGLLAAALLEGAVRAAARPARQ